MRNNTPVTQRELDYDQDLTLMSVTDTQSHIRYANAAFTQLSGFDYEELVGQPHNMVRHPDMPPEAFADMWESLQDRRPWVGLVKNRRKNGDHYWVRANVAPMVRRGQVTGYISVRTKPTRDEIAAAEKLYAEFRQGRAGSRGFRRGLIVRTGAWAFLSLLQRISVAARIHLAMAFVVLGNLGLLAALGMEAGALATVMGATLLVAGLADFWLQGQLTRPLRQVARQAQAVAAGSPGQNSELNRIDEIGVIMRSINQAGLNLRSLVDDIDSQVDGVQDVGQQIGRSGNELASRTEQSASGLEQTAASMEELTSTFSQNTETARQASNLAQGASQAAVQGGEVVSKVVDMMQHITTSSRKIADIITVIDSIAFQTNILALNAAVEAARAGEQGRGFAVVATEVRALAQRSASAAKEIKSLIDASVEGVQAGSVLVEQAGTSMGNIVREVQRVTGLIGEITAASLEQANGVAQINEAVTQLDQVTQQNATMVDESVGAAHTLIAQAERLAAAISVYKSRL